MNYNRVSANLAAYGRATWLLTARQCAAGRMPTAKVPPQPNRPAEGLPALKEGATAVPLCLTLCVQAPACPWST
jgi:hypothetical protein